MCLSGRPTSLTTGVQQWTGNRQGHLAECSGEGTPTQCGPRMALPAVVQGTACAVVLGEPEGGHMGGLTHGGSDLQCELPTSSPLGMEVCGQPAFRLLLTNGASSVPF